MKSKVVEDSQMESIEKPDESMNRQHSKDILDENAKVEERMTGEATNDEIQDKIVDPDKVDALEGNEAQDIT